MLDEAEARISAVAEMRGMLLGAARELRNGWYFGPPDLGPHQVMVGFGGVIVNKQTGFPYTLGSMVARETVCRLYDLGFQASGYDITIVRIADRSMVARVLYAIGVQIIEESFEHETHWKIPRRMTYEEVDAKLAHLPCTFTKVATYFGAEALQEARERGFFDFTLSNPMKHR
jgi:hypothetical protein